MGETQAIGNEVQPVRFQRRFLTDLKTPVVEEIQDPISLLNSIIQAQEREHCSSKNGHNHEGHQYSTSFPPLPQSHRAHSLHPRPSIFQPPKIQNSNQNGRTEGTYGTEESKNGIRMFKCGRCIGVFSSQKSLTIHKLQRHSVLNREQKLRVLGNGASQLDESDEAYTDSLLIGMNPKDILKCTYCPREFPNPSTLKVHMNTHTRERPYECQYCQKRFFQSSHLTVHIRTHTGEKPYQCQFCKNAFNSPSNCRVHERTHMKGNEIFQCEECNIGFLHKSRLERHLRSRKHVHPGGILPKGN